MLRIFARPKLSLVTIKATDESKLLGFFLQLSGPSAVKAKNVYLKLVDQHKTLQNYGVIQLFTQPHPHRLSFDKSLSPLPVRVKQTEVSLNSNYCVSSLICMAVINMYFPTTLGIPG